MSSNDNLPDNKERETIIVTGTDGAMECVDAETGELIWRQLRKQFDRGGKKIPNLFHKYTPELFEKIMEEIAKGRTIGEICRNNDYPDYWTFRQWLRRHKGLRSHYEFAKKCRADAFHDKVLEIAEKDIGKDEAPGERLKADIYMWGAEMNNPDLYGKRTKVSGDPNAPIAFIIDTGIRREGDEPKGDEGVVETTGQPVKEIE